MTLMCGWKISGLWLLKRTLRKERASIFIFEEVDLSVKEKIIPKERENLK